MTTDITELAQSEINDALAQLKQISEYPTPSTQYARVLRKYILALEKALEKAQKQTTESENRVRKQNRHICELFDDNTALRQRIAELESRTVTAAAADVLAERKRQVTTEGWTPEHDDQHVNFEMAIAGGLYAISAVDSHHKLRNSAPSAWPWDRKWWKPDGPRRDLVKAGALILAEIERLDRAAGIKVEAE